jgi:hypothetical protein
MTRVKFLTSTHVRSYAAYSAGDIAQFDDATAADLIARGVAELWDPSAVVPSLETFTSASVEDMEAVLTEIRGL